MKKFILGAITGVVGVIIAGKFAPDFIEKGKKLVEDKINEFKGKTEEKKDDIFSEVK